VRSLFGAVGGASGVKATDELTKNQKLYEGVSLSNLSQNEQANVGIQLNRRREAIDSIKQTGGKDFDALVQSVFKGKETTESVLKDDAKLTQLRESGEYKEVKFDNIRNAMDSVAVTSVAMDAAMNTTKETVEKRFNNALEKASDAVTNFQAGGIEPGKFAQTTGPLFEEMKNSIGSLKNSGILKQNIAGQDFNTLMKNNKSFENVATSLGITSAEGLTQRDSNGLTGLTRIMQSGLSDTATMVKLSEISGGYTTGQKQISEAGALGMEAAKKTGALSFKASASGSEEFDIATQQTTFDFKNRKKLRDANMQEMKYYASAYVNAQTPEEAKTALTAYEMASQQGSKLGNNELMKKYGIGADYNKLTDKVTNAAVGHTLSIPTQLAITGGVPQIPTAISDDPAKEKLKETLQAK